MLDHLAFGALDVSCGSRQDLGELLGVLTAETERLMRAEHRTPAPGRPAGALTITVGFGPTLFDGRFGLAAQRPVALAALPAFPGDALDGGACGGDLCIQACAETRETADGALARLIEVAGDATRVRWFQRASMHRGPSDPPDSRPRNLLGFKDATNVPRRGKDLDRHVWVARGERTWMLGGTFLVVRKVRVLLDAWNALSLAERERVIGRHRDTGAPLGRTHEFDTIPLDDSVIPPDAHARLASPRANGGVTILRRGYSYHDSPDMEGQPEAGLLLLIYQRDPRRQFVPLQRRLADRDALTRYTRTVGSAVFAIPPGTQAGHSLAETLISG